MGRFDVPEILIGMSILAILVWAAYNRTHPNAPYPVPGTGGPDPTPGMPPQSLAGAS